MMALAARMNCKMPAVSKPSPTRIRRHLKLHRPLAARRLLWWQSTIWTGTKPLEQSVCLQNAEPCTGGADDYLQLLTKEIIPTAEKEVGGVPRWRGIAGHSLAGLFALYSIYRTD